jgi:hypothetical protein
MGGAAAKGKLSSEVRLSNFPAGFGRLRGEACHRLWRRRILVR